MSFIDDNPHYKSYVHEQYLTDVLSFSFPSHLKNFIHSQLIKLDEDEIMSTALQLQHELAGLGESEPAYTGSYDYMLDEIMRAFRALKSFPDQMDGLGLILCVFGNEEKFESFLMEEEIGYIATLWMRQVSWEKREEVEKRTEKIEEVISLIPSHYKDTLSNLHQAILLFENAENEKARKSVLRDCVSAVEGYLKSITGEKDIKQADTNIHLMNLSDPIITRDAIKIWNHIHNNLLDVRHGNNENISSLEIEELTYYVERLMAYIKYINSKLK